MSKVNKKPRNTKQLQVVWETIKDDDSHPTADRVYDKVRERVPNVSLGTVYRNLQKLVAAEKLQILMLGRAQHFDPLVKRHQHFICEKCGRVYDVLVDTENDIRPARLPHRGFKVTSHQLAFYGACKHCTRSTDTVYSGRRFVISPFIILACVKI